jgi:acyl-CoA synthetase (NDP forming)
LLRPRSIAVFGGHVAAETVRQCRKIGFSGDIWPVHPHRTEIAGMPAFKTVSDLPAPPDAAFIGVNRTATIEILAALSAVGAGGAVAYASGFAESGGQGTDLQQHFIAAAGDMPVFGPNCYGFINYLDRALIWPDQHGGAPVARGVAIITQSGNIGLNFTMQRRALPIGYLITLGNQAQLDHAAVIDAILDDTRVSAIGLHMESLGDPSALARSIAAAHARDIPVVVLKTGISEAGASIALSHTASLASQASVTDAYFRRIGVAQVTSIPAFLETLKLLHVHGTLPHGTIASLSCSGGEAALMADTATRLGVPFAPLSPSANTAIAATVPELVTISNPLDYHTFGWRNQTALAATFAAMMSAAADMNILILDFPRADLCDPADWHIAADALVDAAKSTGRPAAILATLPETMPESTANTLLQNGILPLFGLEESLLAIRAATQIRCMENPTIQCAPPASALNIKNFSEWEGKTLLAAAGISVPLGRMAHSVEQAATHAAEIGFPIALKAVGSNIAHKTEIGAVKLKIQNNAELREAANELLRHSGTVLVERMVTGTIGELLIGVARDPVLGLYLVLGAGGILAEFLADTATLLLPATRQEITQALANLRIAKLLNGFRGAPPGDTPAAIDAILAIQDFALKNSTLLQELDVNPLMIRAEGQGAVAADVLLRMAENA